MNSTNLDLTNLRSRSILAITLLLIFNISAWILAYNTFSTSPKLLMLCLVAYGFGLRHAVDADHIAAIDNVTRKFLYDNKKSVGIGFFFSLGHSSIVVIMSLFVALGTLFIKIHLVDFQRIGSLIGTMVSAFFLIIIALINFIIFIDTYRAFLKSRKSGLSESALQELASPKGLITSIIKPLFKFVNRAWHMYIVGFLFGLGFDTSTEVALLGISASQAAGDMSVWAIMIFPLLFTSGMTLIDTIDGILMINVYGWALVKPTRKLFYNMMITLLSFSVAIFIGSLEALSIISEKFNLTRGVWSYIQTINDNFDYMGFYIIGIFILCWIFAFVMFKYLDSKKELVS